ncbi:Phospholipase_D-nuclease N-terminal [Paramicrobacterium humi]|uniref:Phospholipase_D-nuclease N-terminal n=1 Tax=Paramicrobacterium humi TaxID=640635 RepID=A0A1H4JNW6_9MICO|nr:PLDc N-terminal domain-containing protein [Microbacterium humi]SEB47586.1 Phospholipase_D-nuclease N-terminal [Microbacterium humi]
MARLLFILIPLIVAVTIYTVVDCAMIDARRVRGLSKPVWLVLILLLPVIGLVLWYMIGRGHASLARDLAPDDDPSFLGELRHDVMQDDRIRQLEAELAALDDETDIIRPRDEKKKPRTNPAPDVDEGHENEPGHRTDPNSKDA